MTAEQQRELADIKALLGELAAGFMKWHSLQTAAFAVEGLDPHSPIANHIRNFPRVQGSRVLWGLEDIGRLYGGDREAASRAMHILLDGREDEAHQLKVEEYAKREAESS